eukprot:m.176320 g.176320  ORF g.176320 m.176320 type:complete len:208 (+) comp39138_c0_seq45:3353-3976(+)
MIQTVILQWISQSEIVMAELQWQTGAEAACSKLTAAQKSVYCQLENLIHYAIDGDEMDANGEVVRVVRIKEVYRKEETERAWPAELQVLVAVKSLCRATTVGVRISWNNWKTFKEFNGFWVQTFGSCVDLFVVSMPVPDVRAGSLFKAHFAVKHEINGIVYWNDYNGRNYFYSLGDSPSTQRGVPPSKSEDSYRSSYPFAVLRKVLM